MAIIIYDYCLELESAFLECMEIEYRCLKAFDLIWIFSQIYSYVVVSVMLFWMCIGWEYS